MPVRKLQRSLSRPVFESFFYSIVIVKPRPAYSSFTPNLSQGNIILSDQINTHIEKNTI